MAIDWTSSKPFQPLFDSIRVGVSDAFGNKTAATATEAQSQYGSAGAIARDSGEKAIDEMKRINEQQMKATMEAAMNNFLLSLTQMLAKQITSGGNAIKNAMG